MRIRLFFRGICLVVLLALTACGGGSSSGSGNSGGGGGGTGGNTGGGSGGGTGGGSGGGTGGGSGGGGGGGGAAVVVDGVASKGPLADAAIEFWLPDTDGMRSGANAYASTMTDGEGRFSLSFQTGTQLSIAVSGGGSFVDESDSTPDPAQKRIIVLTAGDQLEGVALAGSNHVAITMITQAMLIRARDLTANDSFDNAVDTVRAEAIGVFGLDVMTVLPADPITPDPVSPENERQYALLLGGLANIANDVAVRNGMPVPDFEIIKAITRDLSDCRLDGFDVRGPVSFMLNGVFVELPDNLNFNSQIIRFRNNNFEVFADTPVPLVDPSHCAVTPPSGDLTPPVFLALPAPFTVAALDASGTPVTNPVIAAALASAQASDDSGDPVQIVHDAPPVLPLGSTLVTFVATDSSGNTALATVRILVTDQQAPQISAPADVITPQTGGLTQVALGQPVVSDNVTPVAQLVVVNDAPPAGFAPGPHTVVWSVTDAAGLSAADSQDVTVTTLNAPYLVAPIPDAGITEGQPWSLDIGAFFADADGDILQFALDGLPPGSGLSFNPANGLLTGTPTDLAAKASPMLLVATASDAAESISDQFLLSVTDVNNPPQFVIADLNLSEDFTGTASVAAVPVPPSPDEAGQVVTYAISPDPALLGFASLVFDAQNGRLSATAISNANGSQLFTLTANDGQSINNLWQQTFTVDVAPVNDAPVFSLPGDVTLPLDFSGVVTIDVTPAPVPADEIGQTVLYTISPPVNFASVGINPTTGRISISSIAGQTGSQLLIVTANDGGPTNPSYSRSFVLTVGQ